MGGGGAMPAFTGGSDVGADMGTGMDVVALTRGDTTGVDTFTAGSTVDVIAFMSDGADKLPVM